MNDIDYDNNELLELFEAFLSGGVIPSRYIKLRGVIDTLQWLFSFGNTGETIDYHDKCIRYIMSNLVRVPDEKELKKFYDRKMDSLDFKFEMLFSKKPTSIFVSFFCRNGEENLFLKITIVNRYSYSKLIKPLPRLVRADAQDIRNGFFITFKHSKLSMQSPLNS